MKYSTRDRDPLLLPAGQAIAACADERIVAIRQVRDEIMGIGDLRCMDDLLDRAIRLGIGDILRDRPDEDEHFLRDDADVSAQACRSLIPHIDAVDHDRSFVRDRTGAKSD